MKTISLIIFCLPLFMSAQTGDSPEWQGGFRYGLAAGAGLARFPPPKNSFLSGQSTDESSSTQNVGFQACGIANYAFTPHFEVEARAGLSFIQLKGLRSETGNAQSFLFLSPPTRYVNRDTVALRSLWVEVPLIARFRLFKSRVVALDGGVLPALPLYVDGHYASSQWNSARGITYESGALDAQLQLGLYLGFGFCWGEHYQASVNWTRRFVDGHDRAGDAFPVGSWRLMLGYFF
ncbi:MAG: outer membrane beta-barrel protein [Phaeodactylibacter sp.]|nr:outer membrane beta-barrel protein [Phaeodactylibacter sp.]MCB9274426.1 outer membrane beta-barrel protein [Lewinellaceae bacterium]